MIAFIAEHKDHQPAGGLPWGVEPLCRVLREHGVVTSPSTYYEWQSRTPSRRGVRDAEIAELIGAERARHRLVASLGSRKMWLRLRSQGHEVARCTVERIMRQQGWEGASYGRRRPCTTVEDPTAPRSADLVARNFSPTTPNRLWVADFTYCPTWTGMAYVAFVVDAFARRVIGWRAAARMDTPLVLDALEHAVFTRRQEGVTDLAGLVAHSDAGSQSVRVHCPHRQAPGGWYRRVGRHCRRRVGQRAGGVHDRLVQDRDGPPTRTLEEPRRDRGRHLRVGRLLQQRQTTRVPRRLTPYQAEALHYVHRNTLTPTG